ncbi:hypothetical protein [Sphingobacterium sp. HSC-15S19]
MGSAADLHVWVSKGVWKEDAAGTQPAIACCAGAESDHSPLDNGLS